MSRVLVENTKEEEIFSFDEQHQYDYVMAQVNQILDEIFGCDGNPHYGLRI